MRWVNAIHDIMFQRQPPYALQCASNHRSRPDYHATCVLPHLVALERVVDKASSFLLTAFDDILTHPTSNTLASTATSATSATTDAQNPHATRLQAWLGQPSTPAVSSSSSELVVRQRMIHSESDTLLMRLRIYP
jgi:hypothetical protein